MKLEHQEYSSGIGEIPKPQKKRLVMIGSSLDDFPRNQLEKIIKPDVIQLFKAKAKEQML